MFRHVAQRLIFTAMAVAILALAGACQNSGSSSAKPTSTGLAAMPTRALSIRRSDGQQLEFKQAPQRIVSLSPGATEMLYAIGAADALVAVDKYSNYPEAAASFSTKLDGYEPNIESIVAQQPDLVVISVNSGGVVEALDRLKVPVLFQDLDTDVHSVDDVIEQVRVFGNITNHQAQAEALAQDMTLRVAHVEDGVKDVIADEEPRVYHELDPTLYSVSRQSFVGDLYERLRTKNIVGDGGGVNYPQLTQEAIIAANPNVIVLADEQSGITPSVIEARPGWDVIDAVKTHRSYTISPDIVSRPGPRIVDAMEALARDIYPDRFP